MSSRSRRGTLVDRFRGRLMFPIYDLRGDAVGFGARILEGDGPKYLNSPETPIYHKSRLLYGLNWAKSDIVKANEAVVVEGYTDVIAFALAGHNVAVATCGTALVDDHLDLLRRFTARIVLAFDADEAGTGAALRGFEKSMPGELQLRVSALPPGMDPAGLCKMIAATTSWQRSADSKPLLEFRIDEELSRYNINETEARGRAAAAVARLIALHPDPVIRHEYAVMVSRNTGVSLDVLEQAVRAAVAPQGRQTPQQAPRSADLPDRLSGQQKAEQELLRLLLANDPGLREHELSVDLITLPVFRQAYERIAEPIMSLPPGTQPDLGALLAEPRDEISSILSGIALDAKTLPPSTGIIDKLRMGGTDRRIKEIRSALQTVDPESDRQTYSDLTTELVALEQSRTEMRDDR